MPRAVVFASPHPLVDRPWQRWRAHFERQRARPLPSVDDAPELSPAEARVLAWSLARFQIGETGEGRIVGEVARATLPEIDDDYRRALALFVAEEGRHAEVLARLVVGLGGKLLTTTWSARAFAKVRRLAGIRLELLAMFAAEVIGIGFYGALASRLPAGKTRAALEQIAADERAHLRFHQRFFRRAVPGGPRRALFLIAWCSLASAAALVVMWDHRGTLRALGLPPTTMARRLCALVREGAR